MRRLFLFGAAVHAIACLHASTVHVVFANAPLAAVQRRRAHPRTKLDALEQRTFARYPHLFGGDAIYHYGMALVPLPDALYEPHPRAIADLRAALMAHGIRVPLQEATGRKGVRHSGFRDASGLRLAARGLRPAIGIFEMRSAATADETKVRDDPLSQALLASDAVRRHFDNLTTWADPVIKRLFRYEHVYRDSIDSHWIEPLAAMINRPGGPFEIHDVTQFASLAYTPKGSRTTFHPRETDGSILPDTLAIVPRRYALCFVDPGWSVVAHHAFSAALARPENDHIDTAMLNRARQLRGVPHGSPTVELTGVQDDSRLHHVISIASRVLDHENLLDAVRLGGELPPPLPGLEEASVTVGE